MQYFSDKQPFVTFLFFIFATLKQRMYMKIIIDNKIPFIREAIEKIADEVVFLPGGEFTPEQVRDADALIVRTRTLCNRELLAGSRVKLIATATIGFDHIDTEYCRQAGITWTNAPGCNSASVAQYIQSALLLLQTTRGRQLQDMTIGIVGVGNVGSKVAAVAKKLGMRVLLNDLPRAEQEGDTYFTSLECIAKESDVITFHTPLYKEGRHKTFHLADDAFFRMLERKPVLINTSRGEVVETRALCNALQSGVISEAIIDVWEKEPNISLDLLNNVMIGTPHIAGYSADGKANATRMSLDALCQYFGIEANYLVTPPQPTTACISASTLPEALLKIYDPRRDSDALKLHPECFEQLRGDYPLRREEQAYVISLCPLHFF